MSDLLTCIRKLSEDQFEEIRTVRRHLHAHPELSFEEYATSDFVASHLTKLNISHRKVATTGIIAEIEGKSKGKTIALRADLDALPILEKNDVPYRSKHEGVMHACGHDVHTACMLGAVSILNEVRDAFEGTVRVIFQPGEEKLPGGASLVIKDGALENPLPASIIGQHVMPMLPTGKVGFRSGQYMASADEIYLTVQGKGGHAAMPETLVDPVLIASHLVVALQQLVSRNASPKIPSVLSFGTISGKGATNVIPDEVYLEGTFRTFDESWRMEAHQRITDMCQGIASAMGGSVQVDIRKGYPFLNNDPDLTSSAVAAARAYLGEENVVDLDLWMGAEDFAFYSHEVPACFYRLGTRNENLGITSGVHTPTFDIDEDALKTGMGLMAWLAIRSLK